VLSSQHKCLDEYQFRLRGRVFKLTRRDVEEAVKKAKESGVSPKNIRKYYVFVGGTAWPIKQVLSIATGIPVIEFPARTAYKVLKALCFNIEVKS